MLIKPLTTRFRSTNLFRAFLLNAFVTAAVAVFAIELRVLFLNNKSDVYTYFNNMYSGKTLSETFIAFIVFSATFLAAFIVYLSMYVFVDYGGGLLINT
jgi:hypothetical protein|tara:strand:+ start:596 stop:892 length:297 start_codon:yes stop_codon:yes gene_type:complete